MNKYCIDVFLKITKTHKTITKKLNKVLTENIKIK